LSYPQRWREVAVIPLRHERMVLVCAPQHPLAGRSQVHSRELGSYPLIGFEPGLPVARHIRRYLRQHGAQSAMTHVFDNIDTIKSAVAMTRQAAILPRRTVAHEVAAGTLVAVELRPALERPMGIIHAKGRGDGTGALSPAAQEFVDFLIHHIGPEGSGASGGGASGGSGGSGGGPESGSALADAAVRQEQLVGDKP
jgi:DNA-binding transcriptional LysR family regulator